MKRAYSIIAVVVVAVILIAFIWAPIVPFERLVTINSFSSPEVCPGSQICDYKSYNVWATSYGTLAYEYFGYGEAPFGAPVALEKNGVVTMVSFNGTDPSYPTNFVSYPSSTPEPFPILRVNGLTVYPNGAPFGGTVTQISVTNLGTGETLQVNWGTQSSSQSQLVPAGATVMINSTDWTGGPLPAANSNFTIAIYGVVHYPKVWLPYQVQQSVVVTYSS